MPVIFHVCEAVSPVRIRVPSFVRKINCGFMEDCSTVFMRVPLLEMRGTALGEFSEVGIAKYEASKRKFPAERRIFEFK